MGNTKLHTILGQLTDDAVPGATDGGIEGARVEVVDKKTGAVLGSAYTEPDGRFTLTYGSEVAAGRPGVGVPVAAPAGTGTPVVAGNLRRVPLGRLSRLNRLEPLATGAATAPVVVQPTALDVEIRVTHGAESSVVRSVSRRTDGLSHSVLDVVLGGRRFGRYTPIVVGSLNELWAHEAEIVKRINELPNGGHLFMLHPFMALKDVGVTMSAGVRAALMKLEPHIAGASPVPYQALRATKDKQNVKFRLKGLFRRQP